MNSKKLWIIGAVFIALLGYVIFSQTGNRGFSTVRLPDLPKIASEAMERIELSRPEGRLVLTKKDGLWQITEPFVFQAAKHKIENLQRVLSEARLTDVITEQTDRDADFGLTSSTAIGVRVQGPKDKALEMTVGKLNSAGTHTFVRRPGDTRVFQVLGDVASALTEPALAWRSLQVFDFPTDTVKSFSLTWGKKSLNVQKGQEPDDSTAPPAASAGNTPAAKPMRTVWKAQNQPKNLNDMKVNQWINACTRLMANRIVDAPAANLATRPLLAQVRVQTLTGKEYTLDFLEYRPKEKVYWVKRDQDPTVYELADYQGQNLLKEAKDLL